MNATALFKLSYGLYIVSSGNSEKKNGQIANTVFQITSDPPTLAASINKSNLTNEVIRETGVFTVSVLNQDTPLPFIGGFGFKSGRDVDKFDGVNYKTGTTGAPIVTDNSVAYYEVKVNKEVDYGTHTVFIGEIVDADVLSDETPMTYAHYHEVKRGTTPKTAPTYVKKEDLK